MNEKKILVSACLLGERVRYDGEIFPNLPAILQVWSEKGLVVPVCPEVAGGLPVPRPPAEIQGENGAAVLTGCAKVMDINGRDVSAAFINGAIEALRLAEENGCQIAILKARSPSCGKKMIYDGSSSGCLKIGQGVTAALLEGAGIQVYSEEELESLGVLETDNE